MENQPQKPNKKKNKKNKQNNQAKDNEEQKKSEEVPKTVPLIQETPAKKEDKSESNQNQIQEITNPPLVSQIASSGESVSQVKQLADQLKNLNIKMSTEERDQLRDLVEQGDTEESQMKIREMLKDMTTGDDKKRGRVDDKKLKKIASLYDTHNFWDSQPVPKATDVVSSDDYNKQIDEVKTVDDISEEPLQIPAGFTWCNVNIEDDNECKDVYDLLTQNYVEDDDAMFRFDYSIKFLQWALTPPGYKKDWLFGVRGGKKNKLFGFISGIPVHISVNGKSMVMAEINFLCVHRSLRTKKLAPVLIKEVTRRVNRYNIWQAVYTAGIVIPTPIAQSTYWHRSLNPKKLIETGFSSLPHKMPMARFVKMYKTADSTSIPGLRAMTTNDVVPVQLLLNDYMKKFKLHIQFSADEIAHFFLPKEWVIESYVVEDPDTQQVTDFLSFYSLPSTVLRHEVHKILNVAYSYYNVPNKHSITALMSDALVLARQKNYDVFNALDVHDNDQIFQDLKFQVGDGNLNYYLYNWRVENLKPDEVGMVLV